MGGTMSSITINGDTSGSVILQAPSVAGSTTLTLPTTTGTLVTSNAMPTGSVLQVVQTTSTTTNNTTSTTYVASSLTATITPTSTSNKIMIMVGGQLMTSGSGVQMFFTIYRNSTTDLGNTSGSVGFGSLYTSAGGALQAPLFINYLDSPSSTSATTYTIYHRVNAGTGTICNNGCTGTMTLMEIKG